MRAVGLVLIAGLALSCSSSPTAPSPADLNSVVLTEQAHKPNPSSPTHTITLYLLANGFTGRRPVGLSVTVWSESTPEQTLTVNTRGSVTFTVPADDRWVGFAVTDWNGICAESGILSLPGGTEPTWSHTITLKTGCAM